MCLATLICAARAEAFSDEPQAQSPLALGVSDPDQISNRAVIMDNSRDPLFYDDFMRITFLPQTVDVTTPGKSALLRAFSIDSILQAVDHSSANCQS